MRIIGYIRYSTTEQGQRTSPALQLAALEKCAERHGKELSATFHDALPGSAPLHKRPGLQDALAALEAGDILIVYRLDRLARDLELQIRLFRVVTAGGARIVSTMDEGTNADADDDPDAEFLRNLQGALSQREVRVLGKRIRDGIAAKRRAGTKHCHHAPYGWRWDSQGRLAESVSEQRTRSIARTAREAGMSYRAVVAELGRRRRLSRAGRPFSKSQVQRMLVR